MVLHRKRALGPAAAMAVLGAAVLAFGRPATAAGWILWGVCGAGAVLVALYLLATGLRPFRFAAGPAGLDLYTPYVKRQLAWSEMESLSLEATGSGPALYATLKAADHGAEKIKLLDLADVRERPDAVAAGLSEHAGVPFTAAADADLGGRPEFAVVLRGYDIAQVDAVLRECLDPSQARAALDAFCADPAIALRGYDREQVDTYVARLRAELGA